MLDVRAAAAAAVAATSSSTRPARRWSAASTCATGSTSRLCAATKSVHTLELNDLARVHLELSSPLVFDSYRRNRVTGSLIVIDEATNDTVAAGVILDTEVEEAGERPSERSPNVRWQGSRVTRERRWSELGHGGATLWFTGPARRRQVDRRRRGRGAAARDGPAGVPARRRQPAPRSERRPRLRRVRPHRERAPHRATSRGCWRSRGRRAREPRQPLRRRPRDRRRAARGRRARVHRGVRGRAAGAVRAARPEGSLRAGARGRARRA